MFVLLKLESYGKAIPDDGLGQLAAGDGGVTGGDGFKGGGLLIVGKRRSPREKNRASTVDSMQL